MMRCQTCGRENYEGAQYCDQCGVKLVSENDAVYAPPPSEPVNFAAPVYPETPVFQSASVTSVGIPPIVEQIREETPEIPEMPTVAALVPASAPEAENLPKNQNVHAVLIIERGSNAGKEFNLTADESYLGRWDADNGVFPDVDLDSHDPEAKVSRRHARIIFRNGQYQLEDLGSTNGTYINRGRRLLPGTPQLLNDGDELIVGKTFLRFKIAN